MARQGLNRRECNEILEELRRECPSVSDELAVWFAESFALDAVCDFIVIDRRGPGPNCDEVELDIPGIIAAA